MIISSAFLNYRTVIALVLSVVFGLALTALMPFLTAHKIMFVAFPCAAAFFLMLVVKPRATFLLIFMTRPILDLILNLTKVDVGGQDVGFGAILNLLIIVLAVFLIFYEGVFPRNNPVIRNWIFFLAIMFFAMVESPYIGRGVRLYANYLSYFSMFLIPFLIIKDRKDFIFWLKMFAWSFVLPVIYANIDLLHGGQFYADAGQRIKGPFSHPNILAFYLTLGITFYFYLLKSGFFKFRRLAFWTLVLFMLNMAVLLLATKTRNAWIASFGGFLIYGLLKDRKALVLMFLLMPALLLVPAVKDRVVTAFNGKGSLDYDGINSFEWRLKMWKSSIPMIAKRPLQGYGLSSFVPMSRGFSIVGSNGAHNMYVEALFESGMFGLFSLLALLFKPLIIFFKNMYQVFNRRESVVWAIVIGYLISYIVICAADNLSYYLALNWYVWFFIALMILSKRFMEPAPKNPETQIH